MRLAVLVNHAGRVKVNQTTALLMHAAARRGDRVHLMGVGDLEVDPDGVPWARCLESPSPTLDDPDRWMKALRAVQRESVNLLDCDALLIRTNPGRDLGRAPLHETALTICRLARDRGLAVLSDPDGLRRAASKLYLSGLPPHVRPATLVSRNADDIVAFVRSRPEPTILKPLSGTQGIDVFRVMPDEPSNLRPIIDVLVRQGYAMAQAWVPEAHQGDVRLIVMNGQLLEVDGQIAAVRRVPAPGEFRSNVHKGGHPSRAERDRSWMEVVEAIRPHLVADGLFLTGIDLIGDRVVEINVFSPGGLGDAESFYKVDFINPVLDAVAERASRPRLTVAQSLSS